jgi:glycosidase
VVQEGVKDIEHHMLHFLENHDEQRIASGDFAGDAQKGKPAMVVSATISTSPTMIYFGQEVGEPGAEDAGFGKPTRTSIFDYIGVPHHQRWLNFKKFDGGQLSESEKELRDFYKRLLNLTLSSEALMGEYADIHQFNREHTEFYNQRVLTYLRWTANEKLLIIANFDNEEKYGFTLQIPSDRILEWDLKAGTYTMDDILYGAEHKELIVKDSLGMMPIQIEPLQSFIFKLRQ